MDPQDTTNASSGSTAPSPELARREGVRPAGGTQRSVASAFAVLLLLIGLLSLPIGAQRKPHQNPRLANLFLKWHLSDEEARDLARWDVVVLDMEVVKNTPETFALLRRLNPDAKLLAYVTAQEIRRDAATHPEAPLRRALAARIHEPWYLRAADGQQTAWWPETWLLDVTDEATIISGQRWSDALAAFVAEEIASDSRWDGVYYDNLWGSLSWFKQASFDLNADGTVEDARTLDARWVAGMRHLLTRTRELSREGFLITGNGSPIYADLTNGLLLEHFPDTNEGGWSASMRALFSIIQRAAGPVIAIVNTNTGNTGLAEDFRRMRFGLTSALLAGGYYSFDFGDQDHAQRWWYDEYEAYLGDPVGLPVRIDTARSEPFDPAFPPGVYRREYERGIVVVNATDASYRAVFEEEFERLRGTQDPEVNSGEVVTEVTLAPRDGVVLLRPIGGITRTPFTNGAFARVFDHEGRATRNGFFAYDDAVIGGATVEHRDLDGDGVLETIAAIGNRIQVRSNGQIVREFAPFGEQFNDGLDFAIGDLDGNGTWEIVVAQRDRGALVGIFNILQGRLLSPYLAPFGPQVRHGMAVAVAQLSAISRPNIVVGAGRGARPEVRVLDWAGRPTGASFLAYQRSFRGGVHVAAGDVDRDGAEEIITGAGSGGGPHIRVFSDARGTMEAQFFAFDTSRRNGVDVAATDLDGDGKDEIIGMSTYVFTVSNGP